MCVCVCEREREKGIDSNLTVKQTPTSSSTMERHLTNTEAAERKMGINSRSVLHIQAGGSVGKVQPSALSDTI